tara:strand:+ start:1474 stop:1713 length:240 start_codon:yes stop_codon:yes gene_type:complete
MKFDIKDLNYLFMLAMMLFLASYQQFKIHDLETEITELKYYSVDTATHCISKIGQMTQDDFDFCRDLLIKLGYKERDGS